MRDSWRAFWRGFCGTFGVFPVRRYIETPEESMQAVVDNVRSTSREVVGPAIDYETVELLKNDPDEYFRRHPTKWRDFT